jgi:polyhydroxybutyrate depolymerase
LTVRVRISKEPASAALYAGPVRSNPKSPRAAGAALLWLALLGCGDSVSDGGAGASSGAVVAPPSDTSTEGVSASGGMTASSGGSVAVGPGPTGTGGTSETGESGASASGGMTASSGGAGAMDAGTGAAGGTDGGTMVTPAAGCPASATARPGEASKSVMAGGMMRTYFVRVPPGYTGDSPVPVVIDFHPLGGSGSNWGRGNWGALADREGFIMVWPSGVGSSWNVGRCCPPAMNQNVDDVAFVRAILEQLETEACIDEKRVYATGCSNGGGMSYKVACSAADVIAAVAPVDFDCVVGPTNDPSCGGCAPARPISETQSRATNDFAVSYNGGPAPIPQGMSFPGAEANFADWAEINQCTGSPQPLAGRSSCQTYTSCAGGAQTTLCTAQGGTHCGNYASLAIAETAWEMFQKVALP